MSTEVGTAYVVIRAITDKVKDDIRNAVKDGFKNSDADARAAGVRSGRAYADGFREGVNNSRLESVLANAHRAGQRAAGAAGDDAGREYARRYRQRVESELQGSRVPSLTDNSTENEAAATRSSSAARDEASRARRQAQSDQDAADRAAENAAARAAAAARRAATQAARDAARQAADDATPDIPTPRPTPTPRPGNDQPRGPDGRWRPGNSPGGRGGQDEERTITVRAITGPATQALGMLTGMLTKLPILAAASLLPLAVTNAAGSIIAVVGAVSQLAGGLALLPALGVAAGAALATIKIGTTGIGEAFSTAAAAAKESVDSSEAVKAAQQSVASANQGVITSQQSLTSSIRGVEDAEYNQTQSVKAADRAQKDLTQSRKDAVYQLQDLNLQLKGSALSEESANLAIIRAKQALDKTNSSSSDPLERREADLNYRQSLQRLDEIKSSNMQLKDKVQDANAKGVEGSDQVVGALEGVESANRAVEKSHIAVQTANEGVANAQFSLMQATQAAADAQERLNKAQTEGGPAAQAAAKAFANLAPNAQDFVTQTRSLSDSWKDLRMNVQDNLFEGLGDSMSKLGNAQMPVLKTGLSDIASTLNGFGKDFMAAFTDSDSTDQFAVVLGKINQMFQNMRPAITSLVEGFKNLVNVGASFLPGFGDGIAKAAEKFRAWTENGDHIREIIQNAIDTFKVLWEIAGNVGGTLKAVFGAGSEMGMGMLNTFAELTGTMEAFTKSADGESNLALMFAQVRDAGDLLAPVMSEVGEALTIIAPALLAFSSALAPGFGEALQGLNDGLRGLAPAMEPLGAAIGALGEPLGRVLAVVGEVAAQLIDVLGPVLGPLGDAFADLIVALQPAIDAMAGPLQTVISTLIEILPDVTELFTALIDSIVPYIGPITTLVISALNPMLATLQLLTIVLEPLSGVIGAVLVAFLAWKAVTGIIGAVGAMIDTFRTKMASAVIGTQAMTVAQREAMLMSITMSQTMQSSALGGVSAFRNTLSGLATFMTSGGGFGLAIIAATVAIGFLMQRHQEAKRAAEEQKAAIKSLADTLDDTSGAVTDATIAATAQQLATDGVTDSAKKYNISAGQLTAASLGVESSLEAVNTKLQNQITTSLESSQNWDTQKSRYEDAGISMQELSEALTVGGDKYKEVNAKVDAYNTSMGATSATAGDAHLSLVTLAGGMDDAGTGAADLAGQIQDSNTKLSEARQLNKDVHDAMEEGEGTVKKYNDAMGVLTDTTASADQKTKALKDALDALSGGSVDLEGAQSALNAGLDKTGQTLEGLREGYEGNNDGLREYVNGLVEANGTVNTQTENGRNLLDVLSRQKELTLTNAQAAYDSALATSTSNDAEVRKAEATAAASQVVKDSRDRFLEQADAIGLSATNAATLADHYGLLPETVSVAISNPGMLSALETSKAIGDQLAVIDGDHKIHVDSLTEEAQTKLKALGFSIDQNAKDHTFTIAADDEEAKAILDNLQLPGNKIITVDMRLNQLGMTDEAFAGLKAAFAAAANAPGAQQRLDDIRAQQAAASAEYNADPEKWRREHPAPGKAEGGYITGQGTGTSDSIATRLSNGEFVVKAIQTAKHRALLESINNGEDGYAEGGLVGIQRTISGAAAINGAAAGSGSAGTLASGGAGGLGGLLSSAGAGLNGLGEQFSNAWKNTIGPGWVGVGAGILDTKTKLIDPVFNDLTGNLNAFGINMGLTANTAVGPTFTAMADNLLGVKTNTIDPVFAGIEGGINNTAAAFAKGADDIGTQWDAVQGKVAEPVRFVIDKVFNGGIVGAWNSVSDLIGTTKMQPFIPQGFADGGFVSGGVAGKDSVPAMLMPGEFVMTTKAVQQAGLENLTRFNNAARGGSRLSTEGMIPVSPTQAVPAMADGGSVAEAIKRAMDFARAQNGKPYDWGGPPGEFGSFDCSGFMGSIAASINGTPTMQRYWSTEDGGGWKNQGFVPGLGAGFSIGILHGGSGGGHTAGTLGGVAGIPPVNVESGGAANKVQFGGQAAGADNPEFTEQWHLPISADKFASAGMGAGGIGSSQSMATMARGIVDPMTKAIQETAGAFNMPGLVGQLPQQMANRLIEATVSTIDKKTAEMQSVSNAVIGDIAGGVERWRPLVMDALLRTGQSLDDTDRTLKQIEIESSGNPNAINLTDINAQNGIPSRGLLQTIPTTFDAYRDKSLANNIVDPLSNVVAGINYTVDTYGSLKNIWPKTMGYDTGGIIPPGITAVNNMSGVPEALLNAAQWDSVQKAIALAVEISGSNGNRVLASSDKQIIEAAEAAMEEGNRSKADSAAQDARLAGQENVDPDTAASQAMLAAAGPNTTAEDNSGNASIDAIVNSAPVAIPTSSAAEASENMGIGSSAFNTALGDLAKQAGTEILSEFLDPIGLAGFADNAVDWVATQASAAATNGQKTLADYASSAPGGGAGDSKIADQIIFNGMDPQKAMDELRRELSNNAHMSRYRG